MIRLLCSTMFAAVSLVASASAQTSDLVTNFEDLVVEPNSKTVAVREVAQGDIESGEFSIAMAPGTVLAFRLGDPDIYHYVCTKIDMPQQLLDLDGGTIRLVMQHETDPYDRVQIIDEHIAAEWVNDDYGARGRYAGRYGWTRQSGGGDFAWVLGDTVIHNIAHPWDWIFIDDFARFGNGAVLGGNKIQLCVHPHVTARVFFRD